MNVELEVDRYLLVGEVVDEDNSFDHEFGVRRQHDLEIKDFAIISFNDNLEHDVTKAYVGTKLFDYYRDKLIEHAKHIFSVVA